MKPRIAVVDDHTLLTDALEHLLVPDCEVVGKFSDPRAFLARVEQIKPDVAILDVTMPSLNGLDTAREVRRLVPSVRIIMLTMNEDPDVAAEAFRIGVSGYLLKRSAGSELATAVREVMSHHSYVTPFLTQHLVGALIQNPQTAQAHSRADGTTARSAPTTGRGPLDEGSGDRPGPLGQDRRLSQVQDDGAPAHRFDRGADSVRRPRGHRLTAPRSSDRPH